MSAVLFYATTMCLTAFAGVVALRPKSPYTIYFCPIWTLGADCVVVAKVDSTQSYGQQKPKARTVLIQSTLASHYLPHSWFKSLPAERQALRAWIESLLGSDQYSERLLGAVNWCASETFRKPQGVLHYSRSGVAGDDWSFDPSWGRLLRSP